jgi:hypothetical protein
MGLSKARVGNVLAVGELRIVSTERASIDDTHVSIHMYLVALGVEDVVLGVLLGHALCSLLERLHRRVGPPLPKSA